jgi:hypothetical protein
MPIIIILKTFKTALSVLDDESLKHAFINNLPNQSDCHLQHRKRTRWSPNCQSVPNILMYIVSIYSQCNKPRKVLSPSARHILLKTGLFLCGIAFISIVMTSSDRFANFTDSIINHPSCIECF